MTEDAKPGYFELARGAIGDMAELARLDARLFGAEMKANIGALIKCAVVAIFAAAAGVMALAFVAVAAYAGLCAVGLSPPVAALVLAVSLALASLGAAMFVAARLRGWSLMPRRTLEHFRSNMASISEGLANARTDP